MHDGHRDRMRNRIIENGIDSLQPHELIEFILYHAIPRKDTNEIAHKLINKFGSVAKVFSADYNDLLLISGMTKNASLLLSTFPAILRYYKKDLQTNKIKIRTRGDCINYLKPYFMGEQIEKVYLLCLDANNNIIKCVLLSSGLPNQVFVDARQIADVALKQKAVSVIISHNHPSGELKPSQADIELTRSVACALELLQIQLIDHFIFSDNGSFSFYDAGIADIINKKVNRFLKENIVY